jgi:hypothetical protein
MLQPLVLRPPGDSQPPQRKKGRAQRRWGRVLAVGVDPRPRGWHRSRPIADAFRQAVAVVTPLAPETWVAHGAEEELAASTDLARLVHASARCGDAVGTDGHLELLRGVPSAVARAP